MNNYEKMMQGFLEKGFTSVDYCLNTEELAGLRKSLLVHYENDNFHPAGIGNKTQLQTVKTVRKDHIYWLDESKANTAELHFLDRISAFVHELNRHYFTGIRSFELHYAVYEIGSFYKKHIDRFANDDSRQFSMVFYLTEDWVPGDGGELLLYLTDEVVKITPSPGKMVFFDSTLPHEVLPSFKQRLSLTGWMKTR